MFCEKCGEKLEDNVKFCSKCGNPINGNVVGTQTDSKTEKYKEIVNGSKKNKTVGMIAVAIIVLVVIAGAFRLVGGSDKSSDLLVGTWVSEDEEMVVFEDDGSCIAPFTYVGAWWESAEHYTVEKNGNLVMTSKEGHADDSFKQAGSEKEALAHKNMYFVSKDILVIDGEKYSRSE